MFWPSVSRCICDVSRRSAIVYLANAVFPRCPETVYLSIHGTRHTYQDVAFPSCDLILTALHSCYLIFTSWVLYDVNRRISVLKRFAIYLRVPLASCCFTGISDSDPVTCFWVVSSCSLIYLPRSGVPPHPFAGRQSYRVSSLIL